jgi:hypothetical protein
MDSDNDCEFFMRNNMQAIINKTQSYKLFFVITTAGTRRIRNRAFTGKNMIMDILEGHPQRRFDLFRMTPMTFKILCDEVT